MNDQLASELINRSLSEPLSGQELAELQQYLAQSIQSQQYLQLSQKIQQILVQADHAGESGPGLSQLARSRIAKRLAVELAERHSESDGDVRWAAEEKNDYQIRADREDGSDKRSPP